MRKWITATVVAAAAWVGPALAAPTLFSGGGLLARSFGTLPLTGTAAVGDPFRFSFAFNLDSATLVRSDANSATYALTIAEAGATLGRYDFAPGGTTASLNIGRGFAFFGGSSSEPSRIFSFSFGGTAGADAPFALGSGARVDRLSITAIYRDADPSRPLSLTDVIDPAVTPLNSISYTASSGATGAPFGSFSGIFTGGFAVATAPVPEPATWATMVVGFGAVGGLLRRRAQRRGTRAVA